MTMRKSQPEWWFCEPITHKRRSTKKLTEDEVRYRLKKYGMGVELVDGTFKGTMHKARFKCAAAGHVFEKNPRMVIRGDRCPKCFKPPSRFNPGLNIIEKNLHLANCGIPIRFVPAHVATQHSICNFKCLVCSGIFASVACDVIHGHRGCPQCAPRGWWNEHKYIASGHKWIYLYIVEFYPEGKWSLKTGTSWNPRERFKGWGWVQVLAREEGPPHYICQRERDIIKASRAYPTGISKDFGGHSECFTRIIDPKTGWEWR